MRFVPNRPLAQRFTVVGMYLLATSTALSLEAADSDNAKTVAHQIDKLIIAELQKNDIDVADRAGDEDFLRRVTFDIAGTAPIARDVTLFGIDPDPGKRAALIDRLLEADEYATNWSRYWRDVILLRATNERTRRYQPIFEAWLQEQFQQNKKWDEIAAAMITATGDIREHGETLLVFAQEAESADIAAEVSRIFLGIQMQCANCHDHPTDQWKREQFHQLAAFFPRVGLRPIREDNRTLSYEVVSVNQQRRRGNPLAENAVRFVRFLDRNRDGKISKTEAKRNSRLVRDFDRLIENADKNNDRSLSLAELKSFRPQMPNRPGQGQTEHYIPDLDDPTSEGQLVDPAFFVTGIRARQGMTDLERRTILARYVTAKSNPWFAAAFVNRIWSELLGQGFYMPIDDIGPERQAEYPEVLELLAEQFRKHDYNIKWLIRTIANTDAYQRNIATIDPTQPAPPFASATPTRLRGDQLFSAIVKVLGISENVGSSRGPRQMMANGAYAGQRGLRAGFSNLFGFDPSTPQEDIMGTIPQALFMMNSPIINRMIRAFGNTRLSQILRANRNNADAIDELYLLVLAREPSPTESQICLSYINDVGNRNEAFEDMIWSLLNSSEFLSKR